MFFYINIVKKMNLKPEIGNKIKFHIKKNKEPSSHEPSHIKRPYYSGLKDL